MLNVETSAGYFMHMWTTKALKYFKTHFHIESSAPRGQDVMFPQFLAADRTHYNHCIIYIMSN